MAVAVFNNFGTFRKSGGNSNSGDTFLGGTPAFNNYGMLDVQVGLVAISSGTGNGIFNTESNSLTDLNNNYTLTGNPIFSGSGLVEGGLIGSNAVLHWDDPMLMDSSFCSAQ